MAIKTISFLIILFIAKAMADHHRPYESIISFGDSLADTGNYLLSRAPAFSSVGKLPYGETFFHHPTGRYCDGRLIVDFLGMIPSSFFVHGKYHVVSGQDYLYEYPAEAYGLPYLPSYRALHKGQKIPHGVNFAVAGSTAMDAKFFYDNKMGSILWTNDSLGVQLDWFRNLKVTVSTSEDERRQFFKRSLFLVGEIGGNDFNYAFLSGGRIKQVKLIVPQVIGYIIAATTLLIEEGAIELVVPGNLPMGCSTLYLTYFQTINKTAYDQNGCLKSYNAFSKYYNTQLKLALEKLREKYPVAKIIYADYYGAAKRFSHFPLHYGFSNGVSIACCGGGGRYNFNTSKVCGQPLSNVCKDPSTHANWDGIHYTEAAYKHIAKGLLDGTFTFPPLTSPPITKGF